MKRAYNRQEIWDMQFPVAEYEFPTEQGDFEGKLVMKKWTDSQGLICYFETEDGQKLKLCVWQNRDRTKDYRPAHSDLDLSYVELNTMLAVSYTITKTQKTKWLTAEVLAD